MASHAERCPVCYGTGKYNTGEYTPPPDSSGTAVATPQTCHGCGGTGVYVVHDHCCSDSYKVSNNS